MSTQSSYWARTNISRRTLVRSAAATGGGLAAISLIGCGGNSSSTAKTPSGSATSANADQVLDSTKGNPGGTFTFRSAGSIGNLVFVNTVMVGYTHSGLLEFHTGRAGLDGLGITSDPDLAEALPEQPDELTYRFKIRDAKFQNDRTVTSEDIKYSFEKYAQSAQSPTKSDWFWLDRVDTPDPKTAVVKAKLPFADAVASMTARGDAYIMAKEWEESPEAPTKLMGSGPFIYVDNAPPFMTRFRKNPNFFMKPYPYFDQLVAITSTDTPKRLADFISHQTQQEYWFAEDERNQIKQARPDARLWSYETPGFTVEPRLDQAPFTDKRVRQALSLSIDRKQIRDAVSKGEGEPDQALSFSGTGAKVWGFRKPADLGDLAKWWKYDPAMAKQLFSAAGITQPIEVEMNHWDVSVQQPIVDSATLLIAGWRAQGLANIKDVPINFGQYASTAGIGNYNGLTFRASQTATGPKIGVAIASELYSPPGGAKVPTKNIGRIDDPQINVLAQKQLGQFKLDERKQTLRDLEEIMAEQQYRVALSTYSRNYFADPSIKDISIPIDSFGGGRGYVKYWWIG